MTDVYNKEDITKEQFPPDGKGNLWKMHKEINGSKTFFNPGNFVKKCNNVELVMANAGFYNQQNTIQAIWLHSKKTIQPEVVLKALWMLSWKFSQLRLCLAKRDGKMWFKSMDEASVNFKVDDRPVMDVFHHLIDTTYDMWRGPMWKARLVYDPQEKGQVKAVLIFSIQHSITDGIANVVLCRETVEMINRITSGNDLSIDQLSLFSSIEESHKMKCSPWHHANFYMDKAYQTFIGDFSLGNRLTRKDIRNGRHTSLLHHNFTEHETQKLLEKCNLVKLTLNSLITTLMNFAILLFLQSKSKSPIGKKIMKVVHCVNLRRHFEKQHKETTGCNISWLEDATKMSLNDFKYFWPIAKTIHSSITEGIQIKKKHLKILSIMKDVWFLFPLNKLLTDFGCQNQLDSFYVSTDMGNITNLQPRNLSGLDSDVDIYHMLRTSSMNYGVTPLVLAYHTFRNRLLLSIDYCTNKISNEDALAIFDHLRESLNNLCKFDEKT